MPGPVLPRASERGRGDIARQPAQPGIQVRVDGRVLDAGLGIAWAGATLPGAGIARARWAAPGA
ncbi:hypothetical protein RBA09_22725 [Massilia sp. CCM 9029]|nr:hypothetical protein [Massilia sp. CCM 9029]MDQ1833545.1 hypothetical protein [Massilia sp. CCM 9029]